jgi:hypothetical protein
MNGPSQPVGTGTQTSEAPQVAPLEDDEEDDADAEDEDDAAVDDEDDAGVDVEVVLDELSPPAPPPPACGSGPGQPATSAEEQERSAIVREPFHFGYIGTSFAGRAVTAGSRSSSARSPSPCRSGSRRRPHRRGWSGREAW